MRQRRVHRHDDARHRAVLPRQSRPLDGRAPRRHVPAGISAANRTDRPSEERDACGARRRRACSARRRKRYSNSTTAMPSDWARMWPTRRPTCSTRSRRTSGCSSRAPRAPCWTSTTAPSPTSPAATVPAWAFRRGRACPARYITKVLGVVKAYTTRVGGGPFPTEQDNETGEHIRRRGNEYGTVTRRPRRCGWFDAVAARYTARLSGVDVAGRDAAGRA